MEQEIKKDLKDWAKIISQYKQPNNTKAIIQLVNSFGPFIALWTLMYFSLSWSYLITLGLSIINAFFPRPNFYYSTRLWPPIFFPKAKME